MATTDTAAENSSTGGELEETLTRAQLEKLTLEVEELRKKPRWLDPLLQILPVATAAVGIIGFLFTAYQYFSAQKKARASEQIERRLKIESQARVNLAQILQFPTDQKQTVTQMEFLLLDLARLQQTLQTQSKNDEDSGDYSGQETMTTQILANLIHDLDFNESRDVLFADTVLLDSKAYKAFLRQNPDYVKNILAHQEDALAELRRKAPTYFTQLTYDKEKKQYYEPTSAAVTRAQFRLFEQLMNSFAGHLELLSDETSKTEFIKLFQAATCNAALTKYKFGRDFDPKEDLKSFAECVK